MPSREGAEGHEAARSRAGSVWPFLAGLATALAAVLVVWAVGHRGGAGDGEPSRGTAEPASPPVRAEAAAPVDLGMRERVAAAIEEAGRRVRARQLQDYLDSLEQRARAQRTVTALEVETGVAMIERLTGDAGRAAQFARRMEALSRELSPPSDSAPLRTAPESQRKVDDLVGRIPAEPDEARRAVLVREAISSAHTLSFDEEAAALRRIAQASAPPAQGNVDPDRLHEELRAAPDDQRGALIARYVESLEQLPHEERGRRLKDLEREYGRPGAP